MSRPFTSVLLCLLMVLPAIGSASPYERPTAKLPDPMGYVSDHAKVLEDDWRARIRSVAQDLERKTGVEMVVVT
ncbi:MAG TPA: TPM domain-containing protein, partial [Nitrospira sp.]|nr:TPM domain-containing protein [Nitrospira sp.]